MPAGTDFFPVGARLSICKGTPSDAGWAQITQNVGRKYSRKSRRTGLESFLVDRYIQTPNCPYPVLQ